MSEKPSYRVLIVDDHPLMRRGIRQLLATDAIFNVIGEASNGMEALSLANRDSPDIILLDLNMKGLSGLDTLHALRRDGICARVIVLTVSDAPSDIYALMDAGADGYLLKDSAPEHLLDSIRSSDAFSEQVRDVLRHRIAIKETPSPFTVLTERELDVLQEVASGLSNKQIAAVLYISEETVKVHIRNMLRKLNVRSRVAATVLYLETRGQ
ncbi:MULTISPECIES: nitrate/nitrite response regulator protein NarP [Pectobacterium]|uniref:Nitrate/nitrite response regulator protein NarP n=1 Tax=Pectobacterium punjabense TaxID=2108399 RepID=A0ABX6L329_9GAMM|nr:MULTISPECIES: nitrate/nitrite response regulator protein NarP [Pectobacterium]GKW10410.1 DNA-binding response regulator [Pectobacterium carotovorum subsp. carotovorum]MBN3137699.1 nitrate/nitrite response regulator protein NarP [Pectobacterium punjabense]MBS4431739.1 nitrate/nitrite response regulator protein NarP [Pectobacterium punjabense]MCE5379917.1 nitrate/nitrite response regulator protein NarP [Pectobacterium punjabense]MCE9730290.1 DNA-binding response regulator [Pectobacterium sp. 